MNKRILALIVSASALFVGCGTKTVVVEKTAPPTDNTTAVQRTIPPSNPETDYVNQVSSKYPAYVSRVGKKLIVDFAYLVCNAIDNGLTVERLAMMADDAGMDIPMVGYMTGAAINNICPENQWFIDSIL